MEYLPNTEYYLAVVTTWASRALSLTFEPAGHGVTAGVIARAFFSRSTVAGFALVNDAIAARSKVGYLIGLV